MNKIIFLDIDGVLNSNKTYIQTNGLRNAYNILLKENKYDPNLLIQYKLLEIDLKKLMLLKEITDNTNAKIVITSSWRILSSYPLVEDYLINFGLPIIGVTKKLKDRGEEILSYIKEYNIEKYIILDDEIFDDFTDDLKYSIVRTNFYNDALTDEHVNIAIKKLD